MSSSNFRPDVISTDKASSHPLQPGRFYSAVVSSVDVSGRVVVNIPDLNVSFGPVLPLGTTVASKLSVGDSAICTFTDEYFNNLVVFGSAKLKQDVYPTKTEFTTLQSLVSSIESRVSALESQ